MACGAPARASLASHATLKPIATAMHCPHPLTPAPRPRSCPCAVEAQRAFGPDLNLTPLDAPLAAGDDFWRFGHLIFEISTLVQISVVVLLV